MRKCKVFVHGRMAGTLIETDYRRNYQFRYDEDYLADPSGKPVCMAMPLQAEPFVSQYLFPYFFNMLSEGENRAMQAAHHHLDADDDFGILLATAGVDTIGAVTVQPIQ